MHVVWLKDKDARELLNTLIDDYGWRWKPAGGSGHPKGTLRCPDTVGDCWKAINGTPRGDTLRLLRKMYRNCPHKPDGEEPPF